jgi:elongation factor Ts
MAEIDAKLVAKLRAETDAGMMDCKKALTESNGNYDKAKEFLKSKHLAKADKVAGKEATVGCIGSFVQGGRYGALVELACNTDFVVKNDEFQELLKELAIGVVAFNPKYASKDQIPADIVAEEKKKYENDVKGKPPQIAEKIIEGKLDKNLYAVNCLLSMPYPKEDVFKGTYGDLVKAKIAKLGENIVLRRFIRMELGA